MSDDNAFVPGQKEVLNTIRDELELEPMEAPFEYVKKIQKEFEDSKIIFSKDYYDTLGLERPDGTENDIDYVQYESVIFTI